MKKGNGKMNLEKLARMVAKGFGVAGEELGGLKKDVQDFKLEVNERFNRVDDRLDKIDGQFYELYNNDEIFNKGLGKLNKRVGIIEHKVFPKK